MGNASEHFRFNASGSKIWMNCAGMKNLLDAIRKDESERPSGEAASRGTAAHTLGERAITEGRSVDSFLGLTITADGIDFVVDQKMCDDVGLYVSSIRRVIKDSDEFKIEQKLRLMVADEPTGGTVDFMAFQKVTGTLFITDYKNGRTPVTAVENSQLKLYAIPAILAIESNGETVKDVVLSIIQPNSKDGEVLSEWTTSRDDILAWRIVVEQAISAALRPDAPLTSGDHCEWCDCRHKCPALREKIQETAMVDFDDDEAATFPEPADLSPKQIAKLLRFKDITNSFFSAVYKHAQSQVELGALHVPGYKLVKPSKHRRWVNEAAVAAELESLGDEVYTKKLKSPSQIEGLLGKKAVAGLWEKPVGDGYQLVTRDDTREEEVTPEALAFSEGDPLLE